MTDILRQAGVTKRSPRDLLKGQLERRRELAAMFPLARQIVDAGSDAQRAQLILTLSDHILLSHFDALKEACDETGFAAGAGYIVQRYVSLLATRSPEGLLPRDHVDLVENWRRGLGAIAGRSR
jgi:hypothetical protein